MHVKCRVVAIDLVHPHLRVMFVPRKNFDLQGYRPLAPHPFRAVIMGRGAGP
jgi:hypothetical protein